MPDVTLLATDQVRRGLSRQVNGFLDYAGVELVDAVGRELVKLGLPEPLATCTAHRAVYALVRDVLTVEQRYRTVRPAPSIT